MRIRRHSPRATSQILRVLSFEPVTARYIRICSVKPDGPGQKGSQMSVAELEVYE